MTDKSLRIKLVMVSFLEHNLSQQISLFNFRSFNSTRKVSIAKVLIHLRLNLTQPYQTSDSETFCSWAIIFFIIAISLKFYLPPCV